MLDVASSKAGAYIAMSTSSDDDYPPENMLDGRTETFWATTGLFPQEFVVSFPSNMSIQTVQMFSSNVKKVAVYKCTKEDPTEFEQVGEKEMESVEGHLQSEEIALMKTVARHLKFVILSAHDHFISVHKLAISGSEA